MPDEYAVTTGSSGQYKLYENVTCENVERSVRPESFEFDAYPTMYCAADAV